MPANDLFELPSVFVDSGDAGEAAQALIDQAQRRIDALVVQRAFVRLRDGLRSGFPAAVRFSFTIAMCQREEPEVWPGPLFFEGAHFNPLTFERADGSSAQVFSTEAGQLPPEAAHLEGLRDLIGGLPLHVGLRMQGEDIDCRDDRALGILVMGEEGYAAYEASVLNAVAAMGRPALPGQRL